MSNKSYKNKNECNLHLNFFKFGAITLNEFLDDVLESDESDGFVKRVAGSGAVDPLDEGHVTLVAFLEILEDDVERRVVKDKVALALVEFAERLQRDGVLGIDQRQLFDEEQPDDIVPGPVVDWHSRET